MTNVMNISPNNIVGTCNYKCNYYFKYPKSSTSATNYGSFISLSYETSNTPPVIYNDIKYNVSSIQIYSPSLHLFNGSTVASEIVVIHTPVPGSTSGNPLNVCIPINTQGEGNPVSTNIITNVINAVSTGSPSQGESTSQIDEFSLDDLIPRKSFYSYKSTATNETKTIQQFVVYGINNAIVIIANTQTILTNLLPIASATTFLSTPNLFVNTKGPSLKTDASDDIYIDCRPTGNSDETQTVSSSSSTKSQTTNDLTTYLSSPYVMYILFAVIFIIVVLIFNSAILSMHKK